MDEVKKKAYTIAIKYLKYKPRSKKEVKRRLEKEHLDTSLINETLTELEKEGWFDDLLLAKRWTEERLRTRGLSLSAIRYELRQKGIADEIINLALEEIQYDEKEVVFALLDKKKKSAKKESSLISLLIRKGYSYEQARSYLHEWKKKEEE